MFLAIVLLFAGAVQVDATQQATSKTSGAPAPIQKPDTPQTTPTTVSNQSDKPQSERAKATAPAKPQKGRTLRVGVKDSFGVPFLSVRARKALRSEVAAEMERVLKIPVLLGASLKDQELTIDLED